MLWKRVGLVDILYMLWLNAVSGTEHSFALQNILEITFADVQKHALTRGDKVQNQ